MTQTRVLIRVTSRPEGPSRRPESPSVLPVHESRWSHHFNFVGDSRSTSKDSSGMSSNTEIVKLGFSPLLPVRVPPPLSDLLSFAKTLRSRFWRAEIGQFADRPKISDWLRVGDCIPARRRCRVTVERRGRMARAQAGRRTDVAMMEATDFVKLDDPAPVGEFNWPDVRRILVERERRASSDSTRSSERGCGADVFRSGRGRGSDTPGGSNR